jgi:hypothetical protein
MYHGGASGFFADWQEFTGDSAPVVVNPKPRLVLIARTFHGRTHSALEFLVESGVPVDILEVSIYEDGHGRRFLHVESEHEPALAPPIAPDGCRSWVLFIPGERAAALGGKEQPTKVRSRLLLVVHCGRGLAAGDRDSVAGEADGASSRWPRRKAGDSSPLVSAPGQARVNRQGDTGRARRTLRTLGSSGEAHSKYRGNRRAGLSGRSRYSANYERSEEAASQWLC